jgi:hypothetical protein
LGQTSSLEDEQVRPSDTSPEADRVQIRLLRQAGPAKRAALALSLSQTAMELSRRAIRRSNPQATDDELAVLFVKLLYGTPLAEGLRSYLRSRQA